MTAGEHADGGGAASSRESRSRFFAAGCTPRTAPTALREHLAVHDSSLPGLRQRLRAAGIDQAIVLSTCDRVEIVGAAADPEASAKVALAALAETAGMRADALSPYAHALVDGEAVRHLFGIASSLESVVIGEAQVLGQVKAAHRAAEELGMSGTDVDSLMQSAYAAAKRVRSDTAIGERPVTLATSALRVARDLHGDARGIQVALLGTGEMGEVLAERFIMAGAPRLTVLHPVASRAEAVARRLGCHHAAVDLDEASLAAGLQAADVILCALGSGSVIVRAPLVEALLRLRRRRPVLLLDVAAPPDADAAVASMDGAFLSGLDDLDRVVTQGRAHREEAARAAWRIVDEAATSFLAGRSDRPGHAAAARLQRHFEEVRARLLADLGRAAGAEEATRVLVGRLLHAPLSALGDRTLSQAQAQQLVAALRRLFPLDDAQAAEGDARDAQRER
ncbi:MAG: glutamyl-tRNA reductase [Alphaproteobacteria bacterium]|nr:glutamyl-tRNA reductase [Alphaproteobacteria bacterium]